MSKATITSAASSVLGSIAAVAEASSKVVTDVASATDMLTSFINIQKEQQRDRHIISRDEYRSNLQDDYNRRITQRQLELASKFQTDPDFEKLYKSNQEKIEALFSNSTSTES